MAGNANFDAIASTTLKNYREQLTDNIFKKTPLFFWLNSKGRKRTISGGEKIVTQLMYDTNSTIAAYSKYGLLDTTPQEGITAAEYTWRQYAGTINISGLEERQNNSKERIINLLEAKVMQTEKSMRRVLNSDAFSTGGDGSTTLNGLQQLVDIAPTTDTVGGINRATDSFWRNNSTTSVGSFAAGGLDAMRTMYNDCSIEGSDNPDLILTTQAVYESYENTLQPQQRIGSTEVADGGFMNLLWKKTPIVWDDNCTAGYMYFLNSDYLEIAVHPDADMKIEDFQKPIDQDLKSAKILWQGNITMSRAASLGVLSGLTA